MSSVAYVYNIPNSRANLTQLIDSNLGCPTTILMSYMSVISACRCVSSVLGKSWDSGKNWLVRSPKLEDFLESYGVQLSASWWHSLAKVHWVLNDAILIQKIHHSCIKRSSFQFQLFC